ncbi:hypothetical protein AB0F85_03985 [Nocardia fluminea]|uniref:hypothetical protein n=1 Tax=Nocardia fluminea TaxID=134984 RepID=UPI0033EFABC7
MSRSTPQTSAPQPPIADLVTTLEAMREAGWIRAAPGPTPLEATGPTGPHVPPADMPGSQ